MWCIWPTVGGGGGVKNTKIGGIQGTALLVAFIILYHIGNFCVKELLGLLLSAWPLFLAHCWGGGGQTASL